jgi:hypothetical protein
MMLSATWIANPLGNALVVDLLVLAGLLEGLGIVALPAGQPDGSDRATPANGSGLRPAELISHTTSPFNK